MNLLVFNAGSSTLKIGVFDLKGSKHSEGHLEWPAGRPLPDLAQLELLKGIPSPRGIGHRVVHGGTRFRESLLIDGSVKADIRLLSDLAPLHNPRALQIIEACEQAFPRTPQVAAFDTAFFSDLPHRQIVYPLPYRWFEEWGIRRFGFHGISHAYCAKRAAELAGASTAKASRIIICHLGRGCSASAVKGGKAVSTTMGFTPMEGLMMGARSGSIDPGILLYVQRKLGINEEGLERILNQESGLAGVSGVSADYREVESAAARGNAQAKLALEMFADRVRSVIGSFAATMGGVNALIFTGGIGEHSASLRQAACEGLECLGLKLDPKRNESCRPDADVAAADSAVSVWVIRTQEEGLIAEETRRILNGGMVGPA